MAQLRRKGGRVPPAFATFHHAYSYAIGVTVWAPVLALLALTAIAGLILLARVSGY